MSKNKFIRCLGLVAMSKRKILDGKTYNNLFPVPKATDPIISKDGTVHDTVNFCIDIVSKTILDTALLAPILRRTTLNATCEAIFNFFYKHYQYKIDKDGVEQLRRPARAWADRKTGIDCDCFSISVSSVLSNLGIPHFFRIVKMYGRNYYQHIYVIVPKTKNADLNNRKNYYVIDPVLDKYDQEAPKITFKKDTAMKNLGIPIQFLNGVGDLGRDYHGRIKRTRNVNIPVEQSAVVSISKPSPTGAMLITNSPSRLAGLGKEFDELNGFEGSEEELGRAFNRSMKRHLINTRELVRVQPKRISRIYNVPALASSLDELIGAWDDEMKRERTLERLCANEEQILRPELRGLGDIIHGTDDEFFGLLNADVTGNLGGLEGKKIQIRKKSTGSSTPKKKTGPFTKIKNAVKTVKKVTNTVTPKPVKKVITKTKAVVKNPKATVKNTVAKTKTTVKKASAKTKSIVKKIGKQVVKNNPATLAARGGFLVAMKTNFGRIGSRAYWGLFSEAEAKKAGITSSYWKKAKTAYDQIKRVYINVLKGEESALRKAIITGRAAKKAPGLKGLGYSDGIDHLIGFNGLGEPVSAATITAALSFLTPLLQLVNKIFKKGNGKEETETGGEMEATSDDARRAFTETDPGFTTNDNSASTYQREVERNYNSSGSGSSNSSESNTPSESSAPTTSNDTVKTVTPTDTEETSEDGDNNSGGMSTGAKLGLAALGIAIVAGVSISASGKKKESALSGVDGFAKKKESAKLKKNLKRKGIKLPHGYQVEKRKTVKTIKIK